MLEGSGDENGVSTRLTLAMTGVSFYRDSSWQIAGGRYSITTEVLFTSEQQARLTQLVADSGTRPDELVKEVVERYLDKEACFLAAVENGIAAAARGEFVEEQEMDRHLESLFQH